jgi:uncharacterized Zn finger protein
VSDEDWDFQEYIPVAERKRRAEAKRKKLVKAGEQLEPVQATARGIATTFWGRAWCRNLERYSDYESRLPRGRSYLRQGAVLDLRLSAGQVRAQVMGSELYTLTIHVAPIKPAAWRRIRTACAGGIGSTIELLQGRLSDHVMTVITEPGRGLFPEPGEIRMDCSCPDWADLCKHAAAVLYGVGVRLDERPELLFTLRGVDHLELMAAAGGAVAQHAAAAGGVAGDSLAADQLADVFGIELAAEAPAAVPVRVVKKKRRARRRPVKRPAR